MGSGTSSLLVGTTSTSISSKADTSKLYNIKCSRNKSDVINQINIEQVADSE